MSQLLIAAQLALSEAARKISVAGSYDAKGYANSWQENLMANLPLQAIERDLATAAGQELDGKLRAAYSSAALAVNVFGIWRECPSKLPLGSTNFQTMQFEVQCPTGLRGTPPHLDLVAVGDDVVAVESKCTEWMSSKPARFSKSYDDLSTIWGDSPWFAFIEDARRSPNRYEHLDSAQLVKHALGLKRCYSAKRVILLYLFWEPQNADRWKECVTHRAEITDFISRTAGDSVELRTSSYEDLFSSSAGGHFQANHLRYLSARYRVEA